MKYLIILLFPLTAFSLSLTDISNMKLSCGFADGENCVEVWRTVINRVVIQDPICRWSFNNGQAWSDLRPFNCLDILEEFREGCIDEIRPECVRPTWPEVQSEFIVYIAELTAIENARIAELARIQALKDRWQAIPMSHPSLRSVLELDPGNSTYKIRDHIINMIKDPAQNAATETLLTLVEAESIILLAEKAARQQARIDCESFRVNIKSFTLEQFQAKTPTQQMAGLFKAVKCYSEGK